MTDKKIRIILDSRSAEKNAKDLDKAVVGVGKSADRTGFSMNKLAAAIAAALSVGAVIGYVDAWTKVENQLKRTTSSSDELLKVSAELLGVANDTRSSLSTTADLYTSLTVSTKALGVSQKDVIGVTKTINNLFLESGKGASETAGAVRQLGQALESGALRGDEFNSVAEGAPGILRAIEQQTGKTRGELRELAADGEITAELIVTSLRNYSDEAQKAADKTTRTFEQSAVVARNNATAFIGASQALGEAVRLAGDGIVLISENLDKLATVAGAAAALYVARLIPSVVASTTAFAASTAQSIAYQSALARMAGISTTAAAAQTALAAASRAASASMAFLGGPLGVVFLAATALVYFTSQADSAKKATDALSISTANLTKNEAAAAKLRVNDAIDAQSEKLQQLSDNVKLYQGRLKAISDLGGENSKAFAETNEKLIEAKGRYDEVSKSVNQLKDKWIELNNIQNGIQFLSPGAPSGLVDEGESEKDRKARERREAKGREDAERAAAEEARNRENAAREIDSARSVTESLKLELETRLQISQAYRDVQGREDKESYDYQRALLEASLLEQKALVVQRYTEDKQRRNEQLRQSLEDKTIEGDEKILLQMEYDAQEKIAADLKKQELTAIHEKGKAAREEIDKQERENRISAALSIGGSLMQIFDGHSKRAFNASKKLAIASATVDGVRSAISAWRSGMETGGPWAPLVAAAYTAASLAKTSGMISSLKSASYSGGGGGSVGGGGGAIPNIGGGGGSPSINTNVGSQQEQIQQRRIYDFRNIKASDKIPVSALAELLEDDGAVVVLESARDDAARRGVIGVTAR